MAKYIIDVLNTQPDVVQSWGIDPKSIKTIKDGLQFHIKGSKFTGTVTITYMIGLDLFKVETVSDTDRKDVIVHERVYIDHLVRIIDESEEMTTDYEERVKSQFPVIIIDSDQSDKKKQACSKKLVRISEYTEKACSKKAKDKMNTENKQTAVIYARVSSIGDRQNTERQVSDLSALAIQKGLSIEKVYEEHVSGAKKNIDRPVLTECLDFCKSQHISILLVSELSRLGRNTFEVLSTVKDLMDCGINVYFQKEQMYLLDQNGKSGMFTPILIATLGTCAEMEREDIRFRLNSGLANYKAKGGRVGRRTGSVKTEEVKKDEYREVIALLKRGYSVRNTAKLTGKGISTVQRIKKEFVD